VTYDRGASGEHVSYADNAPAAVAYPKRISTAKRCRAPAGPSRLRTLESTRPERRNGQRLGDLHLLGGPQVAGATSSASWRCRIRGLPHERITYTASPAGPQLRGPLDDRGRQPHTSLRRAAGPTCCTDRDQCGTAPGSEVGRHRGDDRRHDLSGASVKFGTSSATGVSCSATLCAAESPAGTGAWM